LRSQWLELQGKGTHPMSGLLSTIIVFCFTGGDDGIVHILHILTGLKINLLK